MAGDCMELTLELDAGKHPPAPKLPQLFAENLAALLAFPVAAAFGGLRRALGLGFRSEGRVGSA